MEIDVISESEVRQIALNTVCEHIKDDECCEDGSIRMDIKDLQDNFNVTQKNLQHYKDECRKLLERVRKLEQEEELSNE